MDTLTPEQRKRNMRSIRGKDTRPEMLIRRGLHAAGLRYRLHVRDLPGRPDIVLPRHRVAILVHGCFWHGHNCSLFRAPRTHGEFWAAKIQSNRLRDARDLSVLLESGWRVLTIWECSLKGRGRQPLPAIIASAVGFVRGSNVSGCLEGKASK
ncbi:Very short patch repair protein [compost metagenome]